MKRLQQVVERVSGDLVQFGDGTIEIEGLRGELKEVQRNNRLLFWVCIAAILALLVAMVCVTLIHFNAPGVVQVLLGVFGASAAGLIRWLVALWREKTLVEMFLIAATYGKGDVVR